MNDEIAATRGETCLLMTVEDAARRLGIGKTLAWQLIWDGVLPSVRLGRLVRVPVRQLEDWIAREAEVGVQS